MKNLSAFLILFALMIGISCDGGAANSNSRTGPPEVKKGVAPVADAEAVLIEMENSAAFGTIKLELYSNIAPKMVERFKELAREGVYNGTTFHRINQAVIQGGDPLSKDADPRNDGTGKSDKPNVPAELSDILYDTGILGAARGQEFDSANSQFFITLKREAGFDNRYTIFGKVVEGMQNVRTIAGVQPKEGERPMEAVRIKSVTIFPHGK